MASSRMSSLRRRAALLQVALMATLGLRVVDATRAAELAPDERASISGPDVEGNAGVVGGFVAWVYDVETAVAVAHVAVSFVLLFAVVWILLRDDPWDGAEKLHLMLAAYVSAGVLITLVAVLFTGGLALPSIFVPHGMGTAGFVLPFAAIAIPLAVTWVNWRATEAFAAESRTPADAK